MYDFETLDATAQAELVRSGQVSPFELVEAAILRAEALNPSLNAIVSPLYDEARRAARAPLPEGPFRGVPFLVKDLAAACNRAPHTEGSRLLETHVADRDSDLVVRFRRAGLVVIGMTHASEFGILPTSETRLFGRTRNPWDTTRSTGGSSGGSAAAVATGIVPMAHANDMGGSIRIPASCCGLFGLKPTRARTPLGPDFGDIASGLVHQHAVTRTVRDSAALLDAIAGPEPGDPYVAPSIGRSYRDEVDRKPGRLRIAWSSKAPNGAYVHDDCIDALIDAARLCDELGHELVEAVPDFGGDSSTAAFVTVYSAYAASTIDHFARVTGRRPQRELFEPQTWALAELGRSNSSADYLTAVTALQRTSRAVARFFADYDVLLTPTLAEPPPVLGTFDSPEDAALLGFFGAGAFAPFSFIANITGQPAMSVPLHFSVDGLPIGVQFVGRFGDEATLFRLAGQLERARPWASRRPPLGRK